MTVEMIIQELPLKQLRKLKVTWRDSAPDSWEAKALRVVSQALVDRAPVKRRASTRNGKVAYL